MVGEWGTLLPVLRCPARLFATAIEGLILPEPSEPTRRQAGASERLVGSCAWCRASPAVMALSAGGDGGGRSPNLPGAIGTRRLRQLGGLCASTLAGGHILGFHRLRLRVSSRARRLNPAKAIVTTAAAWIAIVNTMSNTPQRQLASIRPHLRDCALASRAEGICAMCVLRRGATRHGQGRDRAGRVRACRGTPPARRAGSV